MPHFTVKVAQATVPEVTLEIEADNVDEARELAKEEWFDEASDNMPDPVLTSVIAHA